LQWNTLTRLLAAAELRRWAPTKMRQFFAKVNLLGLLLPVALLTSCERSPRTYSSHGVSVSFPGPFEIRQSHEDTPYGKVHKVGAVSELSACDLAFFTTTYPEALVKPYSAVEVQRKELDMTMTRLGAKLSSVQTETTSSNPYLKFKFELPSGSKKHGEGFLFYHAQKTFLISAIFAQRTNDIDSFFASISKSSIETAQQGAAVGLRGAEEVSRNGTP
jgi:hypothetical protein